MQFVIIHQRCHFFDLFALLYINVQACTHELVPDVQACTYEFVCRARTYKLVHHVQARTSNLVHVRAHMYKLVHLIKEMMYKLASNTSHCKDLDLCPVLKRKIKRICSTGTREESTNPPFLYNETCSFRHNYVRDKTNSYVQACAYELLHHVRNEMYEFVHHVRVCMYELVRTS